MQIVSLRCKGLLYNLSKFSKCLNAQLIAKLRALANTLPVHPHTLDIHLLRRRLVMGQGIGNMAELILLNTKVTLHVVQQVVEVLQIGLVAANVLCSVDCIEVAAF